MNVMKSAHYLSKLILTISILISTVVFMIFPMILEDDPQEEIVIPTIRDAWEGDDILLPTPTVLAVSFADHKGMRIIIFSLCIVAGVLVEALCRNKTITGMYHSVYLLLCSMLGAGFLLACILPYMPC
ncbi:MAG: hypothetical protein SRB1_01184 [Desulfobacteraceae bacterium Eth-SRB1]|nr:MAG: hypothetical protein SRB1_01184 [Desulfobacteraceae bacterium Eth-SRB1]